MKKSFIHLDLNPYFGDSGYPKIRLRVPDPSLYSILMRPIKRKADYAMLLCAKLDLKVNFFGKRLSKKEFKMIFSTHFNGFSMEHTFLV